MKSFAPGFAGVLALAAALSPGSALADKIKHSTAVFSGLDKITGRIISFDVATDETVQFGSLQITPRVCFTRPDTEAPLTDGFVEVDEVETDNQYKRIFSGWMYAASPGLNGVEHPVYDVWLTNCKGSTETVKDTTASLPDEEELPSQQLQPPKPGTVPRPRQARPVTPSNPPRNTAAGSQPSAPPARRAPAQTFFPTAVDPGETQRERDLR